MGRQQLLYSSPNQWLLFAILVDKAKKMEEKPHKTDTQRSLKTSLAGQNAHRLIAIKRKNGLSHSTYATTVPNVKNNRNVNKRRSRRSSLTQLTCRQQIKRDASADHQFNHSFHTMFCLGKKQLDAVPFKQNDSIKCGKTNKTDDENLKQHIALNKRSMIMSVFKQKKIESIVCWYLKEKIEFKVCLWENVNNFASKFPSARFVCVYLGGLKWREEGFFWKR